MALSAQTIRRWDITHRWSSLWCTLFLLILCLTGLPLIFYDEIAALSADPAPARVASHGPALSLDRIVAQTRASNPRALVQFLFWDDQPGTVGLGIADRPEASLEEIRRVSIDQTTGHAVAERPSSSGAMQTILDLHKSLLADLPGELFLGLIAASFVLSLISGIVLYAPFIGRREFGAIRQSARRPRWIDLHNLLGIATAAWLVVVAATGLMNTLEAPLFGAWQADTMPRLLAPYEGKPFPKKLSSIDAALAVAQRAMPGMKPTSIGMPYSRFGSPRHYLIWMKGQTRLTEHFFSTVLVDAGDGRLVAATPLPWYLRALEISRPLHFGDYGGLPLKLLWALLDLVTIVILGSGVYLWLVRARRERAHKPEKSAMLMAELTE